MVLLKLLPALQVDNIELEITNLQGFFFSFKTPKPLKIVLLAMSPSVNVVLINVFFFWFFGLLVLRILINIWPSVV